MVFTGYLSFKQQSRQGVGGSAVAKRFSFCVWLSLAGPLQHTLRQYVRDGGRPALRFHQVCQVGIKQKMRFSFSCCSKTYALKRNTIAFELLLLYFEYYGVFRQIFLQTAFRKDCDSWHL